MIKTVVSVLIIAYLIGALLLFIFQRDLLYHKAPEYQHDLETLVVESQGEKIRVLVLNPNRRSALVYFGGNAEPVIFNEKPFTDHLSEYTIYLVNYRGYGGSSGDPSESALNSDALAVYDQIQARHGSVSVIGRSLGSGVATYLASKRSVSSLVLVTPFDSIQNVAQRHFPIYPSSLLLLDKYNSIDRASQITAKTLILIAELDTIIPSEHAFKLANAFSKEQVSTVVIDGADHNNLSAGLAYYRLIKDYLESTKQAQEQPK